MKDEIQELKNIIHEIENGEDTSDYDIKEKLENYLTTLDEIEKFAEIINEKSLFIKLLIKELQTKEQL